MLNFLYLKAQYFLKLHRHRVQWRKLNTHNRTIASTFFPIDKVKVGNHTYGDLHIQSQKDYDEGLIIGHYCSIARGVWFLLGGNHHYHRFSTYPFRAIFINDSIIETTTKGKIIVEDDVWIGTEAFIMPGLTVGKGAVIAARSVVTRSVPPYAIVGGNPAKVIKYRFEQPVIDKLIKLDFASLSPDLILNNEPLFLKENDFDDLLELIERNKP